jgi:DNA-binding response OmpR family regulator
MITTFQDLTSDDTEPRSRNRLTTRSLRDNEIRALADANYRGDNPLRFDCVRLAALMFERAGYSISLSPEVSPLAVPPQPFVVGDLVVDVMHRTVRFGGRELDLKPREFGLLEILARHPGQVFSRAHLLDCVAARL